VGTKRAGDRRRSEEKALNIRRREWKEKKKEEREVMRSTQNGSQSRSNRRG
jgi:hypothetical protein